MGLYAGLLYKRAEETAKSELAMLVQTYKQPPRLAFTLSFSCGGTYTYKGKQDELHIRKALTRLRRYVIILLLLLCI